MTRAVISESNYRKALDAIKREMAGGLLHAEQELAYQKLLTYRQIGRIIQRDIFIALKELEHVFS